jgi:hypothetical protein
MNPAGGQKSPTARRPGHWEVVLKVQAANKLTNLGYPCGWEEWEAIGKYHGADGLEYTQVRITLPGGTIVQQVKSHMRDGVREWYVDWDLTAERLAFLIKPPEPARVIAETPPVGARRRRKEGMSSTEAAERPQETLGYPSNPNEVFSAAVNPA